MKRRIFLFSVALLLFGASGLLLLEQRASRQAAELAGQAPISVKKAQARPQPRLSAELTRISDTGIHWEERIAAVRELPTHLGQASLDFLFAYLSEPFDEHEENRYLVCNEIMEILRKRSLAPELYTEKLNALIANPKADPIMRDYAAQHLAQWISGISPEATEPDPARIPAALATMLQASTNTEHGQLTLPGTIFQSLADAVINGSEEMKQHSAAIAEQALQVIQDSSFSTLNRSSALQAAARLRAKGIREISLAFAENTALPADLRLSAIAALGQAGSRADTAFLQSLQQDPAYHYAAQNAIQLLQAAPR